jgi:SAM-dependent methyltransferase
MGSTTRAWVWQDDELRHVQRIFDAQQQGKLRRVLDAGAGYTMPLHIPLETHLVALDSSAEALARNENANETIVGDIQTWEASEPFDAAICWWTLEHLPRPKAAIERLAAVLRPGGLLLIGVPYLWGFKAIVTKLTPFRFHLWLARRSDPNAGRDGVAPFPTYMHPDISPRRIQRIAAENGLHPLYVNTYSMNPEQRLPGPLRLVWRTVGYTVRVLTFSRYDPLLSEHVALFRKAS